MRTFTYKIKLNLRVNYIKLIFYVQINNKNLYWNILTVLKGWVNNQTGEKLLTKVSIKIALRIIDTCVQSLTICMILN